MSKYIMIPSKLRGKKTLINYGFKRIKRTIGNHFEIYILPHRTV